MSKEILLESIVVSFVIGSLFFIALVSLAPNSTPYSLNNYGWNGMQALGSEYGIQEVSSISQVHGSNQSVLLEIAPSSQFSYSTGLLARDFLESGGTLVVADSSGFSNSLLRDIGAQILVSGNTIYDPVYNWKQEIVPLVLTSNPGASPFLSGVNALAMSNTSSILIEGQGATTIAYSSPQSEAVNSSTKQIVSSGPFSMAAAQNIGKGKLIVIADSTFFLDSVWTNGDNRLFANNLFQNSTVYLDTSTWPANSQTTINARLFSIYSLISSIPYRYMFAIAFVAMSFLIFQSLADIRSVKPEIPKETRRSRFNNEVLRRVRRDRERYGRESGATAF
ncbi:MAG TPA: DUF4350 domain-containing protein [Nitrososphaerales archaeon]|nr:DUF4350 domain-containing protein [Nitrososphaerales archaeon]